MSSSVARNWELNWRSDDFQQRRFLMAKDNGSDVVAFLTGFVVGGLVGAAVALLFAPQSGEGTRAQIRAKGVEMAEKAKEEVEKARLRAEQALEEARAKAEAVAADLRRRAEEIQAQGQVVLEESRKQLTEAVEGTRKAVTRARGGAPTG
jgi:gas vesicle protein